jgi:hypothetical protein
MTKRQSSIAEEFLEKFLMAVGFAFLLFVLFLHIQDFLVADVDIGALSGL